MNLDLGGGPFPHEGFVSMDLREWGGRTGIVHDMAVMPWPIESGSVDEVYSCNALEHVTWRAWVNGGIVKEMYRVMKPGALAQLIWPELRRIIELSEFSCMCVDFKWYRAKADCPVCGGVGRVHPARVKCDLCGAQDYDDVADIHKNVIPEWEMLGYLKHTGFEIVACRTHCWNLSNCVVIARKPDAV